MGTVVSFALADAPRSARAAIDAACEELHRIDETFSTFKQASVVSRLRRCEVRADELPADVTEVLARCSSARHLTDGWFDPWAMPGGVDPSGLVKGWAVERAAAILRAGGIRSALINGGGDIVCFGVPSGGGPWRIGIRHPWRADALAAIVECESGAVATSGTYERGEHLIDPRTGAPRAAVASATVIGPDLALADALATALTVAGPHLLARVRALVGYDAHLVEWNGTEHTTAGTRLAAGTPASAQASISDDVEEGPAGY
jgi:FAD:protein FMN transferase